MYLMIQNHGVAPVESFTLLGVSTTRDCGVEGTIGQFGSGTKHAINAFLRVGLDVFAYCGNTKLQFSTRIETIDDGLVKKDVQRVICRVNNRNIDLGWVLDFGAMDWNIEMGLREFVSNAIDRTIREEGDFLTAIKENRLYVLPTDTTRAKADHTRVFVEMNRDVRWFYGDLPRKFLHFSDNPELANTSLLEKDEVCSAKVYRCGVFVRDMKTQSRYDYNFKASELKIDESRNSDEYSTRAACALLVRNASASQLHRILKDAITHQDLFEQNFDAHYLLPSYITASDKQKENWTSAWRMVAGDAVACSCITLADLVRKKGYNAVCLQNSAHVSPYARFGIKTEVDVLAEGEKNGKEVLPPSVAAINSLNMVWQWLETHSMTNNQPKPPVFCFKDLMDAGQLTLGFCDTKGIHLEEAHASGLSKMLLQTTLEECAHWVTKATDNSRDFQDFLLRLLVEVLDLG
jgi:hypothetical protein